MSLFRRSKIEKIDGDGTYDFEIAGELHYQENLEKIVGAKTPDGHHFFCEAILQPQSFNPHDKNAVVVTIAKLTVGYLFRDDAAAYRRNTENPMKVDAVIVGGWLLNNGDEGNFGVKLDI